MISLVVTKKKIFNEWMSVSWNTKGAYIKTRISFCRDNVEQRNFFLPSKQIFLIAEILKIGLDLKISLLKGGRNVISLVIFAMNYF